MSSGDLTRAPKCNPLELFRLRDGLYAVDLLGAALVHFDFFTRLAKRPATLKRLCRDLGWAERPADVALTLFTALGLVRARNRTFQVTDLAREFLVKDSPWDLTPYYASLAERPVCKDFVEVLKTGHARSWGSFKRAKSWARAMEDDVFAQRFTAAMDCRGVYLGEAVARTLDLRRRRHVLDIAGGSGIYACALAARHPHLRATVLEKPPVDRVARQAIARRGFAERVDVASGDMFADELPADCDVHLFSNVLHDWDVPVVQRLLKKSFRALSPGGLLVIHDMHLNDSKSGPLPVAQYSCLLMHSTDGKCYSLSELREYLHRVGFVRMKFIPTVADRSVVTATKPR